MRWCGFHGPSVAMPRLVFLPVLEFGDVPAFDWSLEAFSDGDCGYVDVLSVFEDFFCCDGFAEEGFGVV